MIVPHSPSTAMDGPLSYIGGENRLAKCLIAMFPPHVTYCEVFLGGGQVFFRKEPSKVEVINDHEVVNCSGCTQQHPQKMARSLSREASSGKEKRS